MSITQEIEFEASPDKVYGTLMSSDDFGAATGAAARIEDTEGAPFSCFDGKITGRQIELIPNERVVQAWRAGNWPESRYSVVTFDLRAAGSGTRLTLHHEAFPEDASDHLESGWSKMYWEPLARYFGESTD